MLSWCVHLAGVATFVVVVNLGSAVVHAHQCCARTWCPEASHDFCDARVVRPQPLPNAQASGYVADAPPVHIVTAGSQTVVFPCDVVAVACHRAQERAHAWHYACSTRVGRGQSPENTDVRHAA